MGTVTVTDLRESNEEEKVGETKPKLGFVEPETDSTNFVVTDHDIKLFKELLKVIAGNPAEYSELE
jgi:hypothetical protein